MPPKAKRDAASTQATAAASDASSAAHAPAPRLDGLGPDLTQLVASYLPPGRARFPLCEASRSVLQAFAPTITQRLQFTPPEPRLLTAVVLRRVHARYPCLAALHVTQKDSKQPAGGMLHALATCLAACMADAGGGFLADLETLKVRDNRPYRGRGEEMTLVEVVLGAAMSQGALPRLKTLRLHTLPKAWESPLLTALASGACPELSRLYMHNEGVTSKLAEALTRVCEARAARGDCQGLVELDSDVWQTCTWSASPANIDLTTRALRLYLPTSLESLEIHRSEVLGCLQELEVAPALRSLSISCSYVAEALEQLVAGKAPNLTTLMVGLEIEDDVMERCIEAFSQLPKLLSQLREFAFDEAWFSNQHLVQLGQAMGAPDAGGMECLETLSMQLFCDPLTAPAFSPLFDVVRTGGFGALRVLVLDLPWQLPEVNVPALNGDAVVEALTQAWLDPRALAASSQSLRTLVFRGDIRHGDASLVSLARLFERGGLPNLKTLEMGFVSNKKNKVSTKGLGRLGEALATSPLGQSLEEIVMIEPDNGYWLCSRFGHHGFPTGWQVGINTLGTTLLLDEALPRLKNWVGGDACSEELQLAIVEALKKKGQDVFPFTRGKRRYYY